MHRLLTSEGHSTLFGLRLPTAPFIPGPTTQVTELEKRRRGGHRRQRDPGVLSQGAGDETKPTPLPLGTWNAPELRLLPGRATSTGHYGGGIGFSAIASLGIRRMALLCRLHDPSSTVAKSWVLRAMNAPLQHPTLCSPSVLRCQPWGICLLRRPETKRPWGLGWGARGCGAAAPGSLITSARSAPAPSRQLPSNAREFNSSINRREALHFGERWGSCVGLGHNSIGEQARKDRERGC